MPRLNLPYIEGQPIVLAVKRQMTDRRGEVHAGSFLRDRRIVFDASLLTSRGEFARIFVHEVFHFVWLRLGNARRWSYEDLIRRELDTRARGELGWSAEWRKHSLRPADLEGRTARWREYVCESFCDTAASLFSGVRSHGEYTLAPRHRARRRRWYTESGLDQRISI